jgi:hypothetical protein
MSTWTITGFDGINNMQEAAAINQPKVTDKNGNGAGNVELVKCINFDIDDNGGLVRRETSPPIFTKAYDAKLTQVLAGRTFTASGNRLIYSKPFTTETDPRRNSIEYPAAITMILQVETGMWVSTTEKVYFHKGRNPTEVGGFTQTAEYPDPAIMGSGETVPASKLLMERDGFVAVFATTMGICVGTDDGVLRNFSEARFSYVPGQRAISDIYESNGMIRYHVRMINDIGSQYNIQVNPVSLIIDEA